MQSTVKNLLIVSGLAFALISFAVPLAYQYLGYNHFTLALAQVSFLILALAALRLEGVAPSQFGATPVHFIRGFCLTIGTYVAFGVAAVVTTGVEQVYITSFSLLYWLEEWFLTGFSEELLFRGYIFLILVKIIYIRHPKQVWSAWIISAIIFSLWHVPLGLWMGQQLSVLIRDITIPLISAIIFASVYAASGNLWFTAFIHGTTNYPLSPLIKSEPLLGVAFMIIAILIGRAGRESEYSFPHTFLYLETKGDYNAITK
ncbi:MAG: CPBP family intramembrane glutamic endopeptidase [Bacillota bacterium]|nr:CPBP family intramembrane glutamic endopeptidase [Bacillota bacterium]